jgi:hypothetical protein
MSRIYVSIACHMQWASTQIQAYVKSIDNPGENSCGPDRHERS